MRALVAHAQLSNAVLPSDPRCVGNRPASKQLRSGTHKQTNLGYAKLVAENHILDAHRTATARATRDGSEPEAGDDVPESDLSTYEREREENIKANLAHLQELGLAKSN